MTLEYERGVGGWKAMAQRRWKDEGCLNAADAYRKMLRMNGVDSEDAWKRAIDRFPPLDEDQQHTITEQDIKNLEKTFTYGLAKGRQFKNEVLTPAQEAKWVAENWLLYDSEQIKLEDAPNASAAFMLHLASKEPFKFADRYYKVLLASVNSNQEGWEDDKRKIEGALEAYESSVLAARGIRPTETAERPFGEYEIPAGDTESVLEES
jgi:hypothetical protein